MRPFFVVFFLVAIGHLACAQNYGYGFSKATPNNQKRMSSANLNGFLRPSYKKSIVREKLIKATSMKDFFEYYPDLWIEEYTSTQITVKNNGKTQVQKGKDIKLTTAQRKLLQSATFDSEIIIAINYKDRNSIKNQLESGTIRKTLRVVPKYQAKFQTENPTQFLLDQIKEKLNQVGAKKFDTAEIHFTINTQGQAEQIKIIESTMDPKVDDLIIEVIREMPKWLPAKDAKGKNVKQRFEFQLGYMFC
ncbi:MAG TPA: TonB family protein [Saprospiraceae bacterium]|nr:TonB family protein [Saprospiraceae bacterium]